MKKYLRIPCILLLSASVLSGCSSQPNVNDNMQFEKTKMTAPNQFFGFNLNEKERFNLNESAKEIKVEPKTSYYFESMSAEEKEIAAQIQSSFFNSSERYDLTIKIKPDKFKMIMKILLLDEGQNFFVDKSYGYTVDNEGYVKQGIFYYNMIPELREKYIGEMETYFHDKIAEKRGKLIVKGVTEYSTAQEIIQSFTSYFGTKKDMEVLPSGRGFSGDSTKTILPLLTGFGGAVDTEGIAKSFAVLCRQNGVNAIVVYGKPIANDLASYGYVDDKKYSGLQETEEIRGDIHLVRINTDGLYAWNLLKINDKWVNVDIRRYQLFNELVLSNPAYDKRFVMSNYLFVSDGVASMSKMSMDNQDILGIQPMAFSNNFAIPARAGQFMPKTPLTIQTKELVKIIKGVMKEQPKSFSISFEDIDNYQSATRDIYMAFEKFNEDNSTFKVGEIKVVEFPDILTLIITNIGFK